MKNLILAILTFFCASSLMAQVVHKTLEFNPAVDSVIIVKPIMSGDITFTTIPVELEVPTSYHFQIAIPIDQMEIFHTKLFDLGNGNIGYMGLALPLDFKGVTPTLEMPLEFLYMREPIQIDHLQIKASPQRHLKSQIGKLFLVGIAIYAVWHLIVKH